MSCDAASLVAPIESDARRVLTDPPAMRAISHPVRLALLDALLLQGPLTATRAGELVGAAPNTCSFHLRQLAKYGFVTEAGGGPGRNRPWRLTNFGVRFTDVHDDPETRLAASMLGRVLWERYFDRLRTFFDRRESYPLAWREVTGGSQAMVHLTTDELRTVDEQIMAVLEPYRQRMAHPETRLPNGRPVEFLLFAYPAEAPEQVE